MAKTIMLNAIIPKLPMRSKTVTKRFYLNMLGFEQFGGEYNDYLMLQKDGIEVHFFAFEELDANQNYGQVYIRTHKIEEWYQLALDNKLPMPTAGFLQVKPWGQKEFSLLDPDNNLLTFGQRGG